MGRRLSGSPCPSSVCWHLPVRGYSEYSQGYYGVLTVTVALESSRFKSHGCVVQANDSLRPAAPCVSNQSRSAAFGWRCRCLVDHRQRGRVGALRTEPQRVVDGHGEPAVEVAANPNVCLPPQLLRAAASLVWLGLRKRLCRAVSSCGAQWRHGGGSRAWSGWAITDRGPPCSCLACIRHQGA